MKKRTITGLALIGVLLVTGIAIAQPGGNMGNRPMESARGNNPGGGDFFQNMLPMMRILELTDQQREAISVIIQNAKSEIELLHSTEEQGSHREEFINLFSASTLTVADMENHINSRIDDMKDKNTIIAQALVDIHDLLTEEQLAKLASFDPTTMGRGEGPGGNPRGNHNTGGNGGRMNMGVHPNR